MLGVGKEELNWGGGICCTVGRGMGDYGLCLRHN